ncbi:uncharacterized protein LOC9662220 isoform X2 [Selaginella moellendorffii]|uniref:uncharacterized protein LOC9662220 isoform X2 n=1 Tax=Selaginella moellendorffii TaxID=88036 RepID=UPI000D1C716A|nr:uncharacterized protein LOC9662220 isoform X2 [Selaginella moellendorffii]|eukprot:XP_024518129.1 uncharacterized protein LOC9662220 isoform X2 [Selaginella moellendorffii]
MAHRGWGRLVSRSSRIAAASIRPPAFHSAAQDLLRGSYPARNFRIAEKKVADFKQAAVSKALVALRAAENVSNTAWNSIAGTLQPVARRIENLDSGYKEAMALRLEAFCRRNRLILLAALGSGMSIVLWKFGLLVLTTSSVVCAGLALRTRHTINPETVYGIVMRKLQSSAGFMEVMGHPVVGGKVRAYFTSGGDLKLQDLRPRLSCKRCFIVFPVQGYERRGMVSSEVIKEGGQYHVKLLAADIPMDTSDERLYVVGDDRDFEASQGPYFELRDPIFKAIAAEREFDVLDEIEASQQRKRFLAKLDSTIKRGQRWAKRSAELLKR